MKKLLSTFLASTLLLSSLSMTTYAAASFPEQEQPSYMVDYKVGSSTSSENYAEKLRSHGQFGDNIYGTYDSTTNTLTLSGTGTMWDWYGFSGSDMPCNVYEPSTVVIEEGITHVGGYAFNQMSSLTSVVLPSTLLSIGAAAFQSTGLTSVSIPDSVSYLGSRAFPYCFELTSVKLSNSVTVIPDYIFYMSALESLVIPSSVVAINDWALGCKELYIPLSVTDIVITGVMSVGTIYYEGTQEDADNINFWNQYEDDYGTKVPIDQVDPVQDSYVLEEVDRAMERFVLNTVMPHNDSDTNTPEVSTPSSSYPDWVSTFIDFISPVIMPDVSPENYQSESNRGLIAQSLYNMCGDGATYTSRFDDVGSYANAIGWCYEQGVMAGTSDTWFDAEGNVTREQFALILCQLAHTQGKDTSFDVSLLSSFPDGTSGNDWAQSGLAWAVKNGLMNGDDNGNLNPSGDVSRVEVAVMLSNFEKLA